MIPHTISYAYTEESVAKIRVRIRKNPGFVDHPSNALFVPDTREDILLKRCAKLDEKIYKLVGRRSDDNRTVIWAVVHTWKCKSKAEANRIRGRLKTLGLPGTKTTILKMQRAWL